jgi:hypothetical protein
MVAKRRPDADGDQHSNEDDDSADGIVHGVKVARGVEGVTENPESRESSGAIDSGLENLFTEVRH